MILRMVWLFRGGQESGARKVLVLDVAGRDLAPFGVLILLEVMPLVQDPRACTLVQGRTCILECLEVLLVKKKTYKRVKLWERIMTGWEMVCPTSPYRDGVKEKGRRQRGTTHFGPREVSSWSTMRKSDLFVKQLLCARNWEKQFHMKCLM